jgi:hypothetical protein
MLEDKIMLFNPLWKNSPSLDGFIKFLDSKPKTKKYEHSSCETCAIAQYSCSLGKSYNSVYYVLWIPWEKYIAMPRPHTFGAAAKRAKAYRIDLEMQPRLVGKMTITETAKC